MRIVVSGTHGSGKSTLVSDFSARHPHFTVLTDPFELVDEADDMPGPGLFSAQLGVAADRLTIDVPEGDLIAERGPLDFLAYLLAEADLSGRSLDNGGIERAIDRVRTSLHDVDLLVVLPVTDADVIHIGADEYLDLRDAMNGVLLDLIDAPDIVGETIDIVEITGAPSERLERLEDHVRRIDRDVS